MISLCFYDITHVFNVYSTSSSVSGSIECCAYVSDLAQIPCIVLIYLCVTTLIFSTFNLIAA